MHYQSFLVNKANNSVVVRIIISIHQYDQSAQLRQH